MNDMFGGDSMSAPLRKVLVCTPRAAGWDLPEKKARWGELGFLHRPETERALAEHEELCAALEASGGEVCFLPEAPDLTLDAVYAHDPSLVTSFGVICLRMGKPTRVPEAQRHRSYYQGARIPMLGEITPPGTAEAGDIVWLNSSTLLVGRGYRTNASGIEQLGALLSPKGVRVISAPLPHASGPGSCLHLMSLISILDEHTVLVDLPLLAVETVELLCDLGFRLVEIAYEERESLACNVLSLGKRRLIALVQNPGTNQRLRSLGYQVITFSGAEIGINGGGGPTCLTRPLLRSEDSEQ